MRSFYQMLVCTLLIACGTESNELVISDTIDSEMAVDTLTGLIIADHFELVRAQCTPCHSAKLITQNSASREGWEQMIRWMQKDQGLPDLGDNEGFILDYLSQYYGIKKKGRRAPLTDIDWYVLEP